MQAAFLFLLAAQALPWTGLPAPRAVVPVFVAIGIALALFALRGGDPARDEKSPPAAAALVLALGAALRLAFLDRLPPYLDGDATSYAAESLRFLGEDPPPVFATGLWGLTNVYFFVLSIPQLVGERSVAAVRIVGAIGGVLGLVATWSLARRVFGERVALLTATAIAVLPMHLTYSRNGMEFVHVTWVAPLAVLLLAEGWHRREARLVALAGAVVAVGVYVTPAARLVGVVLAVELALLHACEAAPGRSPKRLATAASAVAAGFLVAFAPMIPHYAAHPETFDARVRDVSVLTSDWLGNEIRARGAWRVWATQIRDSLLAFHATPSILPGPQYFWQPFLLPHESALATIGLLAAVRSARRSAVAATILVWLAAGCLFGGILTVTTPKTTRYVILLPAVAILIALGLDRVLGRGSASIRARSARGGALVAYAAIGIAASLVHDGRVVRRHDRTGQVATAAGIRLADAGDPAPQVFFLATAQIDFGAGAALRYLSGASGTDLRARLDCRTLAARRTGERTIVLAPGERVAELFALSRRLRARGHRPQIELDLDPWGDVVVASLEIEAATGDPDSLCGLESAAGIREPTGSNPSRAEPGVALPATGVPSLDARQARRGRN